MEHKSDGSDGRGGGGEGLIAGSGKRVRGARFDVIHEKEDLETGAVTAQAEGRHISSFEIIAASATASKEEDSLQTSFVTDEASFSADEAQHDIRIG